MAPMQPCTSSMQLAPTHSWVSQCLTFSTLNCLTLTPPFAKQQWSSQPWQISAMQDNHMACQCVSAQAPDH